MGVSRSAYYDYVRCTDKCSADPCHEEILETVRGIAKFSNYSYGSRRIGKALNAPGYPAGGWKAGSRGASKTPEEVQDNHGQQSQPTGVREQTESTV